MDGVNHHLKLVGHGGHFEKAKRNPGIAKYRLRVRKKGSRTAGSVDLVRAAGRVGPLHLVPVQA